jgi:cell division protein FtsB
MENLESELKKLRRENHMLKDKISDIERDG